MVRSRPGGEGRCKRASSLESVALRRLARWGALHGPGWFVRYSPPVIGICIGLFGVIPRRRVLQNLRRVRGKRGRLRDVVDVLTTFSSYASCLAEALSSGSARVPMPDVQSRGEEHIDEALGAGRGLVIVTAHTAGWEVVGSRLVRRRGVSLVIVEEAESDPAASAIQDEVRRALGVGIVHAGRDALSSLPLVRHLRSGGIVALQIDRLGREMKGVTVTMFGVPTMVPLGPAKLAMLTGAPILTMFASRLGFRRYEVEVGAPIRLGRAASEEELGAAMRCAAQAMEAFVRRHPTQWFHFRGE